MDMSGFWIIGIILNIVLTGAAVYWVVKQINSGSKRDRND
jgi:hypothetical protein